MAQSPSFISGLTNFFSDRNQQQPGGHQEPAGLDDDPPEEEPEPGIGDHLQQIFTPPEEEEEEEPVIPPVKLGPDGKPLPTKQQTLAVQIQEAISKIGVTDDMIPADFDPSDPKQLRDLISKSNQATALQTIQLAFQPMQMAMEEQMERMAARIESQLSGFGNQQSEAAILKELVPEVEDPQYSGMVQTLFKQSRESKDGKNNPKAAAQMVRNALNAMGVKPTKAASDPFSGSGFKTGKDALDAYAPLKPRTPKPQSNGGQGGNNGA